MLTVVWLGCRPSDQVGAGLRVSVDTSPTGTATTRHVDFETATADWEVVEDLRIGSLAGGDSAAFSEVVTLILGAGGSLYILDQASQQVRVFDSLGAFQFAFGRPGAGPGEFRAAVGLAWSPDQTVWVSDFRNQRYSEFSPSGEFLGSWREHVTHYTLGATLGVDDHGLLYDELLTDAGAALFVRRFRPGAEPTDSLLLTVEQGSPGFRVGRAVLGLPFGWKFVWRVDRRGRIWTARTDRYELHCRTFDGDTLLRVVTDLDPLPVTRDERRAAVAGVEYDMRQLGVHGSPDYSRIPDVKPLIENFDIDDRGRVWVRRRTRDKLVWFDVFSPEGRFLMAVRGPWRVLAFWPVRIRGDTLVTIVKDSLNVSYVVRGRLQRR